MRLSASKLGASASRFFACVVLGGFLGLAACESPTSGSDHGQDSPLDTRLETHAVLAGAPSEAGLAYVQALAEAQRQADAADDASARLEILQAALEATPPTNDDMAELLHLQLATRTGETLLVLDRPEQALALLQPLTAVERSLPLDRISARALVTLGDAAARIGDRGLAMSAYARALEVLSLLLEEAES